MDRVVEFGGITAGAAGTVLQFSVEIRPVTSSKAGRAELQRSGPDSSAPAAARGADLPQFQR